LLVIGGGGGGGGAEEEGECRSLAHTFTNLHIDENSTPQQSPPKCFDPTLITHKS
jgi:hypothetical protein